MKFTTNISSSGLLDVDKTLGGGGHLGKFRVHAAAVVDNQSHGDRNVFVLEQADALKHAVFVNLKILLAQIGGESALAVAHGSLQHHQVDVHRESVRFRGLAIERRRLLGSGRAPEKKSGATKAFMMPCTPRSQHAWIRRYSGCHIASCTC